MEMVGDSELFTEDDEEEDDVMDDGASLGEISDYKVDPLLERPSEHIFLGEEHCRVVWTPASCTATPHVCGMPKDKCSCKHKPLCDQNPSLVATIGWYGPLPPTRKGYTASVDGEVGTFIPLDVVQKHRHDHTAANTSEAANWIDCFLR
jgi:hypothetical protein